MTESEIDRISDLPDGVLGHILSFLRTRDAVRTSVISKRWRNLWTFPSHVDLDYYQFRRRKKFLEFGDNVLNRHETSYLHTFSIRCHDTFCSERKYDHLRRWINSAMKLKPRVFCIEASVTDCDFLADTFICESIENMSLDIKRDGCINSYFDLIPAAVNLPHITRLCLNQSYLNEDTVTKLFTGCPVLEDLILKRCSGEFCSIFRQKLKCLSVIDCYPLNPSEALPESVDLPCIKRLHITKLKLDEESVARLFTGCPLLENLSLENCSGNFSSIFRQKLICLSLIDCYSLNNDEVDPRVLSEILTKSVDLPCIRRLHITKLKIDEESFARLLTGCPLLEYLSLEKCCGKFSNIFSHKLIGLSLIHCFGEYFGDPLVLSEILPKNVDLPCIKRLRITKLNVDEENFARLLAGCPLLEYLSLENCFGKFSNPFRNKIKCLNIWRCNMKTTEDEVWWSIDRAIVKFKSSKDAEVLIVCTLIPRGLIFNCNFPIGCDLDCDNNFEPSTIISACERLKLRFSIAKVDWEKELPRIVAFDKLKSLSLGLADWCMDPYEIDPVVWFLQRSPNIEEITLYNPKRHIVTCINGKPQSLFLCHERSYYDSLSMRLSGFKNLKRLEIKLCKNLFRHSFKEALFRQMKDLVNVKVVLSEFDDHVEESCQGFDEVCTNLV